MVEHLLNMCEALGFGRKVKSEIRSHSTSQAGLELTEILPSRPPKC